MKKENLLCKLFGHKTDLIEETMFEIKKAAINRKSLKGNLICKRCRKVLETLNRVQHCEKCGEEISNRLIDDEVVGYCKNCNWVTHQIPAIKK